jgi:hypothetical protein
MIALEKANSVNLCPQSVWLIERREAVDLSVENSQCAHYKLMILRVRFITDSALRRRFFVSGDW